MIRECCGIPMQGFGPWWRCLKCGKSINLIDHLDVLRKHEAVKREVRKLLREVHVMQASHGFEECAGRDAPYYHDTFLPGDEFTIVGPSKAPGCVVAKSRGGLHVRIRKDAFGL